MSNTSSMHMHALTLARREGDRPQLRERALANGIDSLTDAELLALLIERGTAREALEERVARLWSEGGGLAGIASRGAFALATELGLGSALGARVAAAIELGTRVSRMDGGGLAHSASSPRDVDRWARARLSHLRHEELWVLLLDARNRVLGQRMLARGGLHALALHARDALRPVVREGVSAFVLVHNHPGGDPCPSDEDVRFTQRVAAAAHVLGVSLVDHIVVAREGFVSMLEAGLLDRLDLER